MKVNKRRYKSNGNQKKVHLSKVRVHHDRGREYSALGGLSLLCQLAQRVQFHRKVDEQVGVLKIHQGYAESDHLFHLLSSMVAGSSCIEDVGRLKEDKVYKKLTGVDKVTDPTTMGDFLRRFGRSDLNDLKEAIWQMRERAWDKAGRKLPRHIAVDLDSRVSEVYGNCKQGADFSWKKCFSYHPEMLSIAETGEWLDVVNRSGNEPSGQKAAYLLRRNLPRLSQRFASVCVRGDSKFGRTDVLKECLKHEARVCVSWAAYPNLIRLAEELPEQRWQLMERESKGDAWGQPVEKKRRKGRNLRRQKARRRGYKDKKLLVEHVAEFAYQPTHKKKKMPQTYRMMVIRKQIEVAGKTGLYDQYEYRFILTDLQEPWLEKIVRYARGRSNQENLIEQGKNGVSAFRMPTGQLLANEVWMVMAMLAQCCKSWMCLLALGTDKLGWEWKRFRWHFIYIVARVTRGSRQRHVFFSVGRPQYRVLLRGMIALGAGGG